MPILLSIPIMALMTILQSTVFSRISLLDGTADIVLLAVAGWALQEHARDEWVIALVAGLMVGFVSAIPIWVPIAAYLAVAGMAVYIKRRVWQVPILSLLTVIAAGSILSHLLAFGILALSGSPISFVESLNLIILPGLLLNLLLAIPFRGLLSEVTGWFYPESLES